MIRVLLADDHAIVIEGLRALLDGEPDIKVAAWTTDGTEVVKLVEQHKPDVVVLDLELTSIKGTEVIAALRDRTTPRKSSCSPPTTTASRSARRSTRVPKASRSDRVSQQTLTAIRQVHAGQLVFPGRAPLDRGPRGGGAPGDLTPREREVWALVAGGLTNPQIAERLGCPTTR